MMNRREIVLGLATIAGLAATRSPPANAVTDKISWDAFLKGMQALSQKHARAQIGTDDMGVEGLKLLTRLDVSSPGFEKAVDEAYESGNLFWLWQRLVKQPKLKGGILNVYKKQIVQLHDHPLATGMVRIISGETEVWQFDRVTPLGKGGGEAELKLVYHGIMRPGDFTRLTPTKGNIHALQSVSDECRMLDFFIPPYERSDRFWFEPVQTNWANQDRILCRAIPQHVYGQ